MGAVGTAIGWPGYFIARTEKGTAKSRIVLGLRCSGKIQRESLAVADCVARGFWLSSPERGGGPACCWPASLIAC
jgi:hypothetical protein